MPTSKRKCQTFEKTASQIKKLILDACDLKINSKPLKWKGPKLHESLTHICIDFEKRLTKEHLAKETEQGRDLLDVIIGITLQVGIGMGRDAMVENQELPIKAIKQMLDML